MGKFKSGDTVMCIQPTGVLQLRHLAVYKVEMTFDINNVACATEDCQFISIIDLDTGEIVRSTNGLALKVVSARFTKLEV